MKTYIVTATVGTAGVTDHKFVKQDGSGGVVNNDTAGSEIGVANATKTAGYKVGVIKKGLVWLTGAASTTYNFGDIVELDTDGQTVIVGSTTPIGSVAATKTTTTTDKSIQVLLNLM